MSRLGQSPYNRHLSAQACSCVPLFILEGSSGAVRSLHPADTGKLPMTRFVALSALLVATLAIAPSAIACVVGTGTSGTCTEPGLNNCLPGGASFDGTVSFNCGGAATIAVSSTKVIGRDVTIDGGGLITISGRNGFGVFAVPLLTRFTVENLTIANGYSQKGAAIDSMGTLTVTDSVFSGNNAFGGGGAILVEMGSTASVTNSTFSTNASTDASRAEGGAIYNFGSLIVTNCTFSGNSASIGGGAILNAYSGNATVANSSFSNNRSGMGGAIENDGTLDVANCSFAGNGADSGSGGAILVHDGTATVTNSTFSSNTSGNGGAILSATTLNVTNSTFSGNSAGSGGAICNFGSALNVANSTFSDNSVSGGGGAISNSCSHICPTMLVTNSTFSGNSAAVGGAAINNAGVVAVTVTNSILAGSISGVNCSGSLADGGHNIDDGATCGFTGTRCSNTAGTSMCNVSNPGLATALASNGGPTKTIALEAGSPAIGAGDETACAAAAVNNLDQRGFVRPGMGATNCSIGAYEFNAVSCGDVNGDGVTNIGDGLLVAQVDVGLRQCGQGMFVHAEVCDVNGDGTCNIGDALRMAQCDVGLVSCTFTCRPFSCH